MQAIRTLALAGCALLVGCSFEVAGLSSTGGSQPNGGVAASTTDGGAAGDAGSTALPTSPLPGAPIPTPTSGPNYGAACDALHPCEGGLQCWDQLGVGPKATMLPGGYCTSDCSQTPCQNGATCVDFGGGLHACMADCPPASCRKGYSCCDAGEDTNVCLSGDRCPGH